MPTLPPRACPDAATHPQKPGIIFLVRRTGSAECGPNGARDLISFHRHPAPEFDHRIGRLNFPAGLGVIENGLVRPKLNSNRAPRRVKHRPEFVAGSVRIEWFNTDGHDFLSGFLAMRT